MPDVPPHERTPVPDDFETLLHTLTHDLKGPLANIKGFVELLEEGTLTAEQRQHFLARIRYNTEVLGRLITGLAEYSRLGFTQEPLEEVEAEIVVREVLVRLRPRVEERGAQVEVASLPQVRYRRHRLAEVFEHLIDNALRHGGEHRPLRVEVTCRSTDAEHCFAVRDNGRGLGDVEPDRIFEPFYAPDKKSTGNSGLGLAIVRRIVEGHGGSVWVESAAGEGATFSFTIPVAAANGSTRAGSAGTP